MAHLTTRKSRQRREFLRQCAAISLLGSGAGAMNGKLSLIGSALAAGSDYAALTDYKALVCVFLYGGSDSFSMFVPTDNEAFSQYAASRGSLAIPRDNLLVGKMANGVDSAVGFHPQLSDLHSLYESGQLALFSNVGNLIAPVTRSDYLAGNNLIPNDLFAHNHQQEQWLKGLSSSPAGVVGTGWGGRMADLLRHANEPGALPPSFSLAGSNYWLPGQQIQPMTINPSSGLTPLTYLDSVAGSSFSAARASTFDAIVNLSSSHPFKQQAATQLRRAKYGSARLKATLDANTTFDTAYNASSRLGAQLRMVARLIAGNQQMGMKRQIFFVGAGGWDTHDNQTPRLNGLLADLNRSLSDFQATLAEINMTDAVTTFTASDFGRTLTTNGDGSDHGWGGHYMVMGGAVNGGQLFGKLPSFDVGSDDDTGTKGRVIPTISINQYGALLARWMGVSENDLDEVFPDLANFGSEWGANLKVFSV